MDAIPPSTQHEGPDDQKAQRQGMLEDELRSLQEGIPHTRKTVQGSMTPRYPNWPTSRPGPLASQPGVGQRSINAQRREQMVEVGYDQETGTPREQDPERYWPDEDLKGRTGFDQLGTAQEQKKRGDDPTHPWSRHS
jgi:hypothetical protein